MTDSMNSPVDLPYLEAARRYSPINVDPRDLYWGTGNAAEAHPGVQPPLCSDFWRGHLGYCIRLAFYYLGLWGREEVYHPEGADMHSDFVLGRVAVDVMKGRRLGHLIPGTTGDEFERGVYGSVTPGADDGPPLPRWRHLLVLWNLFALMFTFHRRMHGLNARTLAAWRAACDNLDSLDLEAAVAGFEHECEVRQVEIMPWQNLAGTLSALYIGPLSRLAHELGSPDEAMQVISGLGGVHETAVMDELWEVAQGDRSMARFLREHGYMGQNTGNLVYPNWRESPDSLRPVLDAYRETAAADRPARRAARTAARTRAVLARLAGRTGWLGRFRLKLYFWFCKSYLPLREVGKSAMVAHIALGRLYATRAGALLAEAGLIDAAEDVFYLYRDELRALLRRPADVRERVAERRGIVDVYERLDLPNLFRKDDIDRTWEAFLSGRRPPAATEGSAAAAIVGLGVSAGRAEGIARVVVEPGEVKDFEAGQILVCKMTDPSWSPLFSTAAALVVDIGGMLSHAAIIARELGIPAVINTRTGTRTIPDGRRIAVDGLSGTVEILDSASDDFHAEPDRAERSPAVAPDSGSGTLAGLFDVEAVRGMSDLGIVPLVDAGDAGRFGGKAASLSVSLREGLPVPAGFALSWRCVDAIDAGEPGVLAALDAALNGLTGAVAVRSSGVGEDGTEASFAGQHETVLGASGADDIRAAIGTVAASRLKDHVAAYREKMGQRDLAPRMGVVVQLLVDSDCAGVLFTRNPITGGPDRVIEAAWGLGEVVVASRVSPDHFRVERDSGAVIEALAGHKDRAIRRTAVGDYEERPLDEETAARLCLNEEQLRRLNWLASRCEAVYGGPQDIEWAISGDRLFLLQSRPITTG